MSHYDVCEVGEQVKIQLGDVAIVGARHVVSLQPTHGSAAS